MNFATVMDQIGAALETIPGLRVYPWTANKITPPAAIVDLPDTINYDETYGRGTDRCVITVTVAVGGISARASRDKIAQYANGSGPHSVKAAIEAHTFTACDTPAVPAAEFVVVTFAAVQYLGAQFNIEVHGRGA